MTATFMTFAPQEDETQNGNELVPFQFLATRKTARPAGQSPAGLITQNHDVQKATNNKTENKYPKKKKHLISKRPSKTNPSPKGITPIIIIFDIY